MAEHRIRDRTDVYGARQLAKTVAYSLGFGRRECEELAIVVSELASNIVKYGVRGSIRIEPIGAHADGIVIVARDYGPPFHDLAMALQDGCDDRGPIDPGLLLRRGGLGAGLGAVTRLTHSFRVEQLADGKAIEVMRYRGRALAGGPRRPG